MTPIGRMTPAERLRVLHGIAENLGGQRARLTISTHRDSDHKAYAGVLVAIATPMTGTVSDLVVFLHDGHRHPHAHSASRVVSIVALPSEPAPAAPAVAE